MEMKLTHSDKKFIRLRKGQIRATVLDVKKQDELINQLYSTFSAQPKAEAPVVKEAPKVDKKESKKAEVPKAKKTEKKSKTKAK